MSNDAVKEAARQVLATFGLTRLHKGGLAVIRDQVRRGRNQDQIEDAYDFHFLHSLANAS